MANKVLESRTYTEYNVNVSELNLLKTLCRFGLGTSQQAAIVSLKISHLFVFNGGRIFTNTGAMSLILSDYNKTFLK